MAESDLNIKDIIDRTKSFDQPYAPGIPAGIWEVSLKSYEEKESAKGYKMLLITVSDEDDRISRVNQMLEIQWIEGTIRLLKGLYTHNVEEAEKEAAKEKINKFFDGAKDEADLQNKCVEILKNLIKNGGNGWLKVEFKNEGDQYPDRALFAYKPDYRWKTPADVQPVITDGTISDSGEVEDNNSELFGAK